VSYLERLERRRASWERELSRKGPLAHLAPAVIRELDSEIFAERVMGRAGETGDVSEDESGACPRRDDLRFA